MSKNERNITNFRSQLIQNLKEEFKTNIDIEKIINSINNFIINDKPIKKRQPTAYNIFVKDQMNKIKNNNPEIPNKERLCEIARLWKEQKILAK
jgi:hypothetical protein